MQRSLPLVFVGAVTAVTLWGSPSIAREIPGFPVRLGTGETTSSPAVADIDRNGVLDIVTGVGDMLYAIDAKGRPLEGFPVKLADLPEDAHKRFFSSPALCDLDGNGRLSIVSGGPDKNLYVHGPTGEPRAGFPIAMGMQLSSAPLCADVDNNGTKDIVVAVPTKHIVAFDRSGKRLRGFPVRGIVPSESAIAAADLTPGGPLELLVGGEDGKLYLFDGRGVVDRRRAKTSFRITGGASLGDVDGDGKFDVVFGSQDFSMYAVDFESFEMKRGFPVKSGYRIYGAPALGDINGDDVVDVVFASADGKVYAVNSAGTPLPGWPAKHDGKVIGSPSIGDLDLDGKPEIVAISDDGKVYVWDQRGRQVRGTPFAAPGKNKTSPVIVQLDGRRGPEVVVVDALGNLHAFSVRTRGKLAAARIPWPTFGHDAERVSRTRPNPSTFNSLAVLPEEPVTTSDLRVNYIFSDLDGTDEGATKIAWFRNGKRMKAFNDKRVVPAASTKKGERWMARVQGADDAALFGEGKGARFYKTPITRILNTPPAAPKLVAEGAAAGDVRFADGIKIKVGQGAFDPDGDKIRYRTIWSINESPQRLKSNAMALPAKYARRGQRVSVLVIPIDNEEEGEPARLQWTMANTPPTSPSIALTPSVPTRATGVTLKVNRMGFDVDKDPIVVRTEWTLDGKPLRLLSTAREVPGALLTRGGKLAVKVFGHDGFIGSTSVAASTVIGNTPPGRPKVSVGPSDATASTPISAQITERAPDADGDVPTYSIAWAESGKPVAALNGKWVVSTSFLKKGQNWRATVTPNDGAASGPTSTAGLRIGNRAPTPPVVAISPQTPTRISEMKLNIVTPSSDVDGDKTTDSIRWFADDTEIPARFVRGNTLRPGAFKKGQRLRGEVIARDGMTTSLPAGDTVIVGDLPPSAPKVAFQPAAPRTQTDLNVTIAAPGSDPDADPVSYRFHWFVNGARVDIPNTATTLPSKYFIEGDAVSTSVWSIADSRPSESPATVETKVLSTAPPTPVVEIFPSKPLPGEPLRMQVVKQEPDVDGHPVRYAVTWKRNRSKSKDGVDGVAKGVTKKGEQWSVHVVAVDGDDKAPAATASIVIGNQAPVAPRIELSHSSVPTTQPVALKITRPASDTDGDALKLAVEWKRNGKVDPTLNGARSVPAASTKKGETFEVAVVANDGTDQSEPVRRSFRVVDTPPTQPRIAFSPKVPVAGTNVEVKVTGPSTDVDGDSIRYEITWFLDGKRIKTKKSKFTLAGRKLRVGKELRAKVVAVAARAKSAPAEARADVAPARPNPPSIVVLPKSPVGGQTLFAKVAPPTDRGTPADVQISWLRNGAPANVNAPSVPGARVKRGEKWEAIAVATIAGRNSKPVRSSVTVGNRPPLPPVMALSSRSVTTDQPVKVRIEKPASDPDGDAVTVTIAWTKNGKLQRALNGKDTVPANLTRKGDRWVVRMSSTDKNLRAPDVTDGFVVENTAPPSSSVTLSPTSPKSGQAITATISPSAADADGDRIRHRVRFLVDGVAVAAHDGKSFRLPPSSFRRGQRVTVEIVPYDGEADGPVSRAHVTSENSAPSIAAVSVRPAKATGADTLTCAPTSAATDPDKDPVDVIVSWEIDGKRTGAGGKSVTLSPGSAQPGAKVRCLAYATDGSLSSPEVASAPVEVGSRAPGNIAVSMVPKVVTTGASVACGATGSPNDPDGEPISVTVDAYVNGRAVGGHAIDAGVLKAGQSVECRAYPSDVRTRGDVVKASTKVMNARPTAPVAKISHPWPRAGVDDLSCNVASRASDPENDKLLYRIEWIRNGKPAGLATNARRVQAAALKPADVWACRLYARDGGGEGPPSASVHAYVRKPPPKGTAPTATNAAASR